MAQQRAPQLARAALVQARQRRHQRTRRQHRQRLHRNATRRHLRPRRAAQAAKAEQRHGRRLLSGDVAKIMTGLARLRQVSTTPRASPLAVHASCADNAAHTGWRTGARACCTSALLRASAAQARPAAFAALTRTRNHMRALG
jgi:hypothetical protein